MYVVKGDTIRLNTVFKTFAGVATDSTSVSLTVYDDHRNTLISPGTSVGGVANGTASGAFYYDYTPPNVGLYFYEFKGTLESNIIADKGTFYVVWA